jgi:hypothetical protein
VRLQSEVAISNLQIDRCEASAVRLHETASRKLPKIGPIGFLHEQRDLSRELGQRGSRYHPPKGGIFQPSTSAVALRTVSRRFFEDQMILTAQSV